jgi:hypothetical protein
MSQIPSVIALPAEMQIGTVDSSLPPSARANNMRIFPTNVSSVTSSAVSQIVAGAAGYVAEGTMPTTTIIFDLPAGTSPSSFLDPRTLTLNFRMTVTQTVANAGAGNIASAYLRSSAYSFFDRFYVNTQNGIAEDITEYGVVADTLLNMTQNESQRDGTALLYGMNGLYNNNGNQGAALGIYAGRAPALNDTETLSFSIPVISSLVGCTANKFFNIGRTSKMQLAFQTTNIVPISMLTNGVTTAGAHTVTLNDFYLSMSTVDIGSEALRMLDAGLVDGKAYYSGTTYKTTTCSTMPVGSVGTQSLLVGVRGSSVKSLVARFYDGLPASADGSVNGKYDSKCPNANSMNFNVKESVVFLMFLLIHYSTHPAHLGRHS